MYAWIGDRAVKHVEPTQPCSLMLRHPAHCDWQQRISSGRLSKERNAMGEKVYLTRKAIAERAQARGIPLTINVINHDAHRGCGPRHVAEYAGKVRLYTIEE